MNPTSAAILFLFIIASSPNSQAQVTYQFVPPDFSSEGAWQFLQASIGISAMHMQLLRYDKVVMFDRTDFGPSNISLPDGRCRTDPSDTALNVDCTAHSVLYDIPTNTFRPLMVQTDTWCSSGSVLPNGTLVQTGGYNDGQLRIRMFTSCQDQTCDWIEFPDYLSRRRWYATNQILPDGRIIVVGGRRQFNYEFYPRNPTQYSSSSTQALFLPFLQETTDPNENNLYPFLHLLPDGNLFIFANTRSILFDYSRNLVLKEFPLIPGEDPRNYPSTGSSVLLPINDNKPSVEAEVMICGGAPRSSFVKAREGNFIQALATCGRLRVTDPSPNWVMETMPMPRVLGDMLLLPSGDVIIINGAGLGTAGWEHGRGAVLSPVIYRPSEEDSSLRFRAMSAASRPRVYHSSAVLLPDGRVLVGGSNPHMNYTFSGVEFPTELSLEAFSPPYLSPEFDPMRPTILYTTCNDGLGYMVLCHITFRVTYYISASEVSARLVAPSFTTHSFAMNQRMVVLNQIVVARTGWDTYYTTVVGPSSPQIAPPGFYLMFVVHAGIPSTAVWLQVL
ncbi:aldehyde oxidase GLOX-like [Prosopis cineraria]|uniref:aldehyde oxidase GLOX-like n=1 Tax=Prosopis cineraria TaxID=364024 RepID=UPI00240F7856|nr:aldehyde oxidase GLOX-like [Prosopis cineraria]